MSSACDTIQAMLIASGVISSSSGSSSYAGRALLSDSSPASAILKAVNSALASGGDAATAEARTVAQIAAEARANAEETLGRINYGRTSSGTHDVGTLIQGLRNRLFLKFISIDAESMNKYDQRFSS